MIRVGDRVAFNRKDAKISNHACGAFGIDYFNCLEFKDCKFYKGLVTKIKTHAWFFFKLDNPIYIIDDYYVTDNVRLIMSANEYSFCNTQFARYSINDRLCIFQQNKDFINFFDGEVGKKSL